MNTNENQEALTSSENVIRQSFRMPINNCSNISLHIENQPYEIVNIGSRGLAFYSDESEETLKDFSSTHQLSLQLKDNTINLQGQTMHVSPSGYKEICGIKFVNMKQEAQEIIEKYLHDTLTSLFEKQE